MERAIAPEQRVIVIVWELPRHHHGVERLPGRSLQISLVEPALHPRAAFVGEDESHGDIQDRPQLTGEEIAYGGTVADMGHIGATPPARRVIEGLAAHHRRDLQEADAVIA